ncbi:hypothetical protein V2G26_001077 [Clonostachys chloroleuca]
MLALSTLTRASIALLLYANTVTADIRDVRLTAEDDLPPWALESTLQMKLTTDSTNYAVIPLTEGLGLGSNSISRQIVQFNGTFKSAKSSTYMNITDPDDVAYMSCDKPDDSSKPMPLAMLDVLMNAAPRAIVLYTTSKNWCFLDNTRDLPYPSILSMVDPAEATAVLSHINETASAPAVRVSIYGNTTDMTKPVPPDHAGGKKSQVAMSILYSITGLITLLFLLIIVTGAVRAHRYPERYGPRRADGDRPSQSRAKGLAKAVLETIPIVKFVGGKRPSKPDPDLEMETATTDGHETPATRAMSHTSELKSGQAVDGTESVRRPSDVWTDSDVSSETDMGCSICTEDFRVGEDVRVLPCNHQFHPNCIDPWLINISGTCPLCRLDLRPGHHESQDGHEVEGSMTLPPPLAWEGGEHDALQSSYRNRVSRLFDVNRLRQATAEEQMEALRQLREDRITRGSVASDLQESQPAEEEQRHQGTPFADKLREKFRILTKSQSALGRSS